MNPIAIYDGENKPFILQTPEGLSLNRDALTLRDQALDASKKITELSNAFQMEACNPVLRLLKGAVNFMDESRTYLKAPLILAGRRLDALANEYSAPLEVEEARLKKLVADYMEKLRERQIEDLKATGETNVDASAGTGIAMSERPDFEITDLELAYKSNPELFKVEPKRSLILGRLKGGDDLPGIKALMKSSVRVTV